MKYLYLALALLAASCTPRSVYVDPGNRADRMLHYYEKDRRDKDHAISSEELDLTTRVVEQIPKAALVDIDSKVQINVRKPPPAPGEELIGAGGDQLETDKNRIIELMDLLEIYLDASAKAVAAYAAGDPADELITDQAKKQNEFIAKFVERYPRRPLSDGYREANKLVGKNGGLGALRGFLQAELDSIKERDDAIQNAAEARSSTLRIEAFLDNGEEVTALHVPGYDSLAEQSLQSRDRAGLNLSQSEREKLMNQIKATEDVARTLESARKKEISVYEAVKRTLKTVAPELEKKVVEGEALAKSLTSQERLDELKQSIDAAVQKAQTDTDQLAQDLKTKIQGLPDKLMEEHKKSSEGIQKIFGIAAEAKALGDRWEKVRDSQDLSEVTALLLDSRNLAGRIVEALKELPDVISQAKTDTQAFLELEVQGYNADVLTKFEEYMGSAELQEAKKNIVAYQTDVRKAVELVAAILKDLNIGQDHTERVIPDVPEAFDVDLQDMQDTTIDLRRVPAQDGDTVIVHATLTEPGRAPVKSKAEFEITHYGWHAKLSPSVVMVRPDELASGADEFRFAPALGWMHHFRPRPGTDKWYANMMRPLQPAVGLHTTFLNFDNESGVGIGGTVSLWDDRLQAGIGYNLSAGSSDEGQTYYFIGSDLIGLLQTVGVGGQP